MFSKTKTHQSARVAFVSVVTVTLGLFFVFMATTAVSADTHHPGGSNQISSDCTNSLQPEDCDIMRYIALITNGLSVIVGIVVVMMLIIAGIRYSSAGGNPQAIASAKQHIYKALLALTLYLFLFAFLQWIIPGGFL